MIYKKNAFKGRYCNCCESGIAMFAWRVTFNNVNSPFNNIPEIALSSTFMSVHWFRALDEGGQEIFIIDSKSFPQVSKHKGAILLHLK